MLFCYSPDATSENWLHETLYAIIDAGLEAIVAGGSPLPWPDCIPAAYWEKLENRSGLQHRLDKLFTVAKSLHPKQLETVLSALRTQNNFPDLLRDGTLCPDQSKLPSKIRKPVEELARFAFSLLTDLGIRDRHYSTIYDNLSDRVCPFCGYEPFDAPGAPRHDLDHYLPISRYAFSGFNLKNLVPAGDRCNKAYKRDKDLLYSSLNQRRECFDPYGQVVADVSLLGSRPFEGKEGRVPLWHINLGNDPAVDAWDELWSIRERYQRDVLDVEYDRWLTHFARWCKGDGRRPTTPNELDNDLGDYVQIVVQEGLSERAFLKRAVFEMLRVETTTGTQAERLCVFLIKLISFEYGAIM